MPTPLVECVPNFSEGCDRAKIDRILEAIRSVSGVKVLNVELGTDTNRAVVTFIGSPEAAEQAAFLSIACAAQVIDMSRHSGAHPRIGATDVCPFVPVQGATMDDCAAMARRLGARVGRELEIPVYLYEAAASRAERRSLSDIRRGEYEGLAAKLADPAWQPDFGPARFNPRTGATVIGARQFLIAYNINLNSTNKEHADDIALELREKGRVARRGSASPYYGRGEKLFYQEGAFPCGSCAFVGESYEAVEAHCAERHGYDLGALLRANGVPAPHVVGKPAYRPGLFKACKAMGWYVADYQRAQVSVNLTDYTVTPPHAVFDAVCRLAAERGLVVTGSEIVGLIPFQAMMMAGRHYLAKQGRPVGQPVGDVLRTAVISLGLTDVAPFEIEKKVLGVPALPPHALMGRTVHEFTDEVSRDSLVPSGAVAALAGALGAALASMVANLTHGNAGIEARAPELARITEEAQRLKDQLIAAADAEREALQQRTEAMRRTQGSADEKAFRARRLEECAQAMVEIHWATAAASLASMKLARAVAEIGSHKSIHDGGVGVQIAYVGARGGAWRALLDLANVTDAAYVAEKREACAHLLGEARALAEQSAAYVDARLAMFEEGAAPSPAGACEPRTRASRPRAGDAAPGGVTERRKDEIR